MVALLRPRPGDLVTLADRFVLLPVAPLTGPAAVGDIAAAPAGTGILGGTHVTRDHLRDTNLELV